MIFCTQDLLQKLHFHQAVLWALWFVHKKRFLVNPQNLEDRTKTKSWYFSLKLDRTPTIVYLTEKSATLTHQSRNPKGRCWMFSSSSLDRKKKKKQIEDHTTKAWSFRNPVTLLGSLAAWYHNTTYAKLKWQKKNWQLWTCTRQKSLITSLLLGIQEAAPSLSHNSDDTHSGVKVIERSWI